MVSFRQPNGLLSGPKLSRLQDLQAEIFRQLQLLIPDEVAFHDQLKSRVAGSPLLHMQVLERHPFTTFFRLTYEFASIEPVESAPDAHVRFYHDARLAEAVSFDCAQGCRRDNHPAYPFHQMAQRAWRRNKALDRWLDYLLQQGHSMVTMRPAGSPKSIAGDMRSLVAVN